MTFLVIQGKVLFLIFSLSSDKLLSARLLTLMSQSFAMKLSTNHRTRVALFWLIPGSARHLPLLPLFFNSQII